MRKCLAVACLALPNYAQIVTPEWLDKERPDPQLVILDARPQADYAKGHLPGALLINTYDHLVDSSPQGEKKFHAWLAQELGRLGLGPKDRVVVYEDKMGIRAGRAFWMLWYAGQPKVGLLEGGLEAWKQRGLPVSTQPAPARAPTAYKLKPQRKWIATRDEVTSYTNNKKVVLLDVRTREEFEGQSGSADCAKQGAIPGAVWVEWTAFLSPDRMTVQAPEKLGMLLLEKGITPDKQVVAYCHRGARAAMVWAALDHLGYPRIKNYVGSWHDWAAR
jgi:thiosulfate/3-mercaptopyruvate sulfurtransferase